MLLNKLYDSIRNKAVYFFKRMCLVAYSEDYLLFNFSSSKFFANVTILRTSRHTFRVRSFVFKRGYYKNACYYTFNSISDLCAYLDTLSLQLV